MDSVNEQKSNKKPWLIVGGVAGVAFVLWLAFGFFGVHTLFTDDEVSEAGPVFDEPAATAAPVAVDTTEPAPAATDAPADDAAPATTQAPAATTPPTTAAPEIVTEFAGAFVSKGNYNTSGDALVLGNGTGQRFLRFENFETSNGPDLFVYLFNSSTGDESDFVDLGELKGNIGEQNYEVPAEVDLSAYDQVTIWCKRFSTAFGSADLAAQ